jgi:hypothetical protein
MKKTLVGLLPALLFIVTVAQGGVVWEVFLADTAVALADNCTNDTAFGLPDGTGADILWDRNRNGRDDTLGNFQDSLALVCRYAPSCPNNTGRDTLNFSAFYLNGEEQEIGRGKFICNQYLIAYGPSANPQWLPRPDSFYVRVCGDSVYWESEIFSPPARIGPQNIFLHNWRCVHRPPPCWEVPISRPLVRNFHASDSSYCSGILLEWSPNPSSGDSIFLYRNDTLFARVSATAADYMDFAAPTGVVVRYSAVARRYGPCPTQSPRVFDNGYRLAAPPPVTQVTSSDDSVGRIRICWNYQTNAGIDSFAIFRDGFEIQKVARGEPGTQCWMYYTSDPTRHEFCIASWNRHCGYSDIRIPGCCDTTSPPPPPFPFVDATDGLCNQTAVTWNNMPGAVGYRIWRTPANSPTPAVRIATVLEPNRLFVYSTGSCGVSYRFYVIAYNAAGPAPDSLYDIGYRVYAPDAPVRVQASDGQFYDRTRVSWPAVSGPCPVTSFVIYRNGSAFDSVAAADTLFDDMLSVPGIHYAYSVSAVNQCGTSGPSPADSGYIQTLDSREEEPALPTRTALHECYPNPFNARTTIVFDLAQTERVRVAVYDLMGREIAVLTEGTSSAGSYAVAFNGSYLPSGVYICRMEAGKFVAQQKLLLLK